MLDPRSEEIDLRPMWRRVPRVEPAGKEMVKAGVYIGLGALLTLTVQVVYQAAHPVVAVEPLALTARSAPVRQAAPIPPPVIPPPVIERSPEPEAEAAGETPALVAPPAATSADRKAEREQPAKTSGTLELETTPRLVVYKGARRLGRTPLEVKLDAGTHRLRFVDRGRFLDVKRRFRIKAGKTLRRSLVFGTSRLRVDAPKGTRLYLNGRKLGRAPFKPIEVFEGRHHVKLVKRRRRHAEWLRVPPSRTVDLRVTF